MQTLDDWLKSNKESFVIPKNDTNIELNISIEDSMIKLSKGNKSLSSFIEELNKFSNLISDFSKSLIKLEPSKLSSIEKTEIEESFVKEYINNHFEYYSDYPIHLDNGMILYEYFTWKDKSELDISERLVGRLVGNRWMVDILDMEYTNYYLINLIKE